MLFDLKIFERMVESAYRDSGSSYTFGEVMCIFKCYFDRYEQHTGKEHPRLNKWQVKKIIDELPYVGDVGVEPEDYFVMIDRYFKNVKYTNYNINHFMSGRVREMRMYEAFL